MKTKILLMAMAATAAVPLMAQDRSLPDRRVEPPSRSDAPRVRRVPSQAQPSQARVRPSGSSVRQESGNHHPLSENITLHLKGSFQKGPDLDLTLTGIGPVFSADTMVSDQNELVTHRYTVSKTDAGYLVDYAVGMRVTRETSRNGGVVNVEYRDVTVTGKVLLTAGEPVVIARNGERALSLAIDLAKKD